MVEYSKDKEFSTGWMFGGVLLMFVLNWFGGFVAAGAGVHSIWIMLLVALGAFAVGGFVIGWRSEGQTIVEAGLAAVIAIGISCALKGLPTINPIALAIGFGLPFGAAVFGAWIGELVQGDIIVRSDD